MVGVPKSIVLFRKSNNNGRNRLNRTIAAVIEQLEPRVVLSPEIWTGGTGNWSVPTNWSPAQVPGMSDDVTIPAGGNVTISGDEAAGMITTDVGSSLTVDTGAQFSEGGGTISGSFNVDGTVNQDGSPLTLAGTTVVTGTLLAISTINEGSLTFDGGGPVGGTFTNDGTVTVTNGITLGGGAIFTNSAQGIVNITDDGGFNLSPLSGAGGTLINEGTLNQTGGTGVDSFGVGEFENIGGTVNIESGTFAVRMTAALEGGQMNVATGAMLSFDSGVPISVYNITLSGTLTGSGGGTIFLGVGNFYAENPDESQANATLDFPSGMLQVGAAEFGQAGYTVYNAGFLDFVGSAPHGVTNMTNEGTVINSGTTNLELQDLVNAPTGILDFQSDAGVAYVTANALGITNQGLIEKTAGTGVSVLAGTFFNDGGSLDIASGSLEIQGGGIGFIAGPIHISAGSSLDFDTTNGVFVQGTLTSTGGGTVSVTGGWLDGPSDDYDENENGTAAPRLCPGHADVRRGIPARRQRPEFRQHRHHQFRSQRRPIGSNVQFRHDQFCRWPV